MNKQTYLRLKHSFHIAERAADINIFVENITQLIQTEDIQTLYSDIVDIDINIDDIISRVVKI